ncbi:hypothetical protein AB1Y20_006332 [Prymnesium parvum]|uniref:Uncharacterized protein n=1 Tax=Prymnesium parvum TaxID=97485 RepID=A0AB34J4D7_PRYPA
MNDPLVAHCVVGALRSFVLPQIHTSIKSELVDSMSRRAVVFLSVSLDCTAGGDVAACGAPTLAQLQHATAFLGVHLLLISPPTPPPPTLCEPRLRFLPTFWHRFSKVRLCLDEVLAYEAREEEAFAWLVLSRPDHEWKGAAPPAASLPYDRITTGNVWAHNRGQLAQVEDHFLAVPRPLAEVAFRAVDVWRRPCRSAEEHAALCRIWRRDESALPSECLLGLHLFSHNVSWQSSGLFNYQSRRTPPSNASVRRHGAVPFVWVATARGLCWWGPSDAAARRKTAYYRARLAELNEFGAINESARGPPQFWRETVEGAIANSSRKLSRCDVLAAGDAAQARLQSSYR